MATAAQVAGTNRTSLSYLITLAISSLTSGILMGYVFAFIFYVIYCVLCINKSGYGPKINHYAPVSYCLGDVNIPYRYYQSYTLPKTYGTLPISSPDSNIIVTTSITNSDNYNSIKYNTLFTNTPYLIDFKNTSIFSNNSITITNNTFVVNQPPTSQILKFWIKCIFSTEFYYSGILLKNNYDTITSGVGGKKDISYIPLSIEIYGQDNSGLCTLVHPNIVDNKFKIDATKNKPTETYIVKNRLMNKTFKTYYISMTYSANAKNMLFGNMSFIGIPGDTPIYDCKM